MKDKQILQELAAQAADGNISAQDDLSHIRDSHFTDNIKRLSALKSIFRRTNKNQPSNIESEVPESWGHLRIVEIIGQGAFGSVYKAFDSVLHRDVALKLRRVKQQNASTNSFIVEARRLARVYHPNVLAVHGADIHDNRVGLWSDLIDGETLQAKLERSGNFSSDEIVSIAEQLLHALEAIHQQDLIHGDIKTENVMIVEARIILMDFGAAQRVGDTATFGSPASMAPEQRDGIGVSTATDVYSLGALLYKLSVDPAKPSDNQTSELNEFLVNQNLLDSKLGKTFSRLIVAMLSIKPVARPSTNSILQELADLKKRPARRLKIMTISSILFSLVIALVFSLFATQQAEENYKNSETVKNLVISSLAKLSPQQDLGPNAAKEMYQTMAEKVRVELSGNPQIQANMFVTIGKNLFDIGDPKQGLVLVKEGLDLMLKTHPDYVDDLQSMYNTLSILYRFAGKFKLAASAIDKSLYYHSLTEDSSSLEAQKRLVKLFTTKANLIGRLGDWHGRLQLNQEVLQLRKNLVGEENDWLAIDYYHIGQSLFRLNLYQRSLSAYLTAEKLLDQNGDNKSIRFLYVKTGLMSVYEKLNENGKARDLLTFLRQRYPLQVANNHSIFMTLDFTDAQLTFLDGNVNDAIKLLEQIVRNPSTRSVQSYQVKLKLVEYLILSNNWERASFYLKQIQKDPVITYAPLFPYVKGAAYYLRFKKGEISTPPIAELNQALLEMKQQQYHNISEYRDLQFWRDSLLKPHP